jgi:predicted MFS family arabinose efflux permease
MQAYLSDRVPYARRGLVLALTETSWSLAFIIGIPLIGLLISLAGWGSPFGVLGGLGLVAFLILAFTLPGTPPADGQHIDIWHTLRLVLVHRPALAVLVTSFGITAANECVNLVFGVWIEQAFNLQLASLAAASVIIGLSELSGEGLSGALVDRIGKERSIAIGIGLTALAALALPYVGHSLEGALVGLFFFYLTFEFTIVCELPLVSEVLPEARATLMAANVTAFSLGRAVGSLIAPALFSMGIQALNLLALAALRFVRIKSRS